MKTRKKKIEIEFDPEEFVARVERLAAGKESISETTLKLPQPIKSISAKEIRSIRTRLGFTQAQFAAFLNIPKSTAVSWESGLHKPNGAALRLLEVAKNHPEALEAA